MSNEMLRLVVIAAVAFVAYQVLSKDGLVKNVGMLSSEVLDKLPKLPQLPQLPQLLQNKKTVHRQINDVNANVLPAPQMSNNFAPQGNYKPSTSHNFAQLDCFPKDQLVAADLLPRDGGFAESNPAPQGTLMNRNLFESGHHAGLNTQSNTLKNANLQLRSDPLIARRDVGPWNQSTFESDTNRRPFEIGTA